MSVKEIHSLTEYVGEICKLKETLKRFPGLNYEIFLFRGQSNKEYKLEPTLARKRDSSLSISIFNHERDLIEMAQNKLPDIFNNYSSPLELLALLQHYAIPTRLMDVSENPLVALFFSCNSSKDNDGEVIVFKHDDIDTGNIPIVNPIADSYRLIGDQNTEISLEDFLRKAKEEPYFREYKHIADFLLSNTKKDASGNYTPDAWISKCCESPLFVYAPTRIMRQYAQSGRYILFPNKIDKYLYDENQKAFVSEIVPIDKNNSCIETRYIIPKEAKERILSELKLFAITKETIFPDNIDIVCQGIKNMFMERV